MKAALAPLPETIIAGGDCAERILKIVQRLQQEMETSEAAFQFRLAQATEERQRLADHIAGLERSLDTAAAANTEKLDHFKDVERRLDEALTSKAQLAQDLQRAVSELSTQAQLRTPSESDEARHAEIATILQCEIARSQLLCEDLEKQLADPVIDLPAQIRLNRQLWELQSYLKGLRYSIGDVTLQPAPPLTDTCNA